jgi:acetolactate synthase-1/2/3 large subunit
MVNIVGEHATYHLQYDTPPTSNIAAVAAPMSDWVHTGSCAEQVAQDAAAAVAAAKTAPGQIATLILPADACWSEGSQGAAPMPPIPHPKPVNRGAIEGAVKALRSGEPCMLVLGGPLSSNRLETASRVANSVGARLACETFPSRITRGAGRAQIEKLPYVPELAIESLKGIKHLLLIGSQPPASFFAYPHLPSMMTEKGCQLLQVAELQHDLDDALDRLSEAVQAPDNAASCYTFDPPELPTGELNPSTIADSIAALLPDDAIIVDEGITSGGYVFSRTAHAAPHDWIAQTGGASGWGLPAATGAAIAAPDRKVICLEGDGSAMYTNQALWTMARENLDVTTIIFTNRDSAILQREDALAGVTGMGKNARGIMSIGNPDIDYVAMAESMGVSASRATTAEEFSRQFATAMKDRGPNLIEACCRDNLFFHNSSS